MTQVKMRMGEETRQGAVACRDGAARGLWQTKILMFTLVSLAILATGFPAFARGTPESFSDLAERLSPAVVNISTEQIIERADRGSGGQRQGSPFDEFFRDFLDNNDQSAPRRTATLGSGFLISADGLVVTNNHVIDGADEITVNLSDGTQFDAELVGRDAKTDIALLRVSSKKKLPFVDFGSSDDTRVGDWVIAIGNPFGLGGTVTAGIVSARNREINGGGLYSDFIQTDASINQGNSGGPLFNLNGKVIGVNSAIYSTTGGSVGIGFAIPSALAQNIVNQLITYGETRRGWLGVRVQQVTPDLAESMELGDARGALVSEVISKSPASKSGLSVGDVILSFDGKPIERMRDLPRVVAETKVGKRVEVEAFRGGKKQSFRVKVERLEEQEPVIAAAEPVEPDRSVSKALGLSLVELDNATRERYGIADTVSGVLVVDVEATSPAYGAVQPGDVIVEVAQEEVLSPNAVINMVERSEKAGAEKPLLFLVSRGGAMTFVTIKQENG